MTFAHTGHCINIWAAGTQDAMPHACVWGGPSSTTEDANPVHRTRAVRPVPRPVIRQLIRDTCPPADCATGLEASRSHDGRQRADLPNRGRCTCECFCVGWHVHASSDSGLETRNISALQHRYPHPGTPIAAYRSRPRSARSGNSHLAGPTFLGLVGARSPQGDSAWRGLSLDLSRS
jgi:hypothetical protein